MLVFVIIGLLIYIFLVWPVNDVRKNSLRGKIHLPSVVKEIPVLEVCTEPLYTYSMADCGAGTCPDIYEVSYQTKADTEMLSSSIEGYIQSLDNPIEYTLEVNSKEMSTSSCSSVLIEFLIPN